MSTETLIPFDLEVAKKHPERVRHYHRTWWRDFSLVENEGGIAFVKMDDGYAYAFGSAEFGSLRLAAPPKRVTKWQFGAYGHRPDRVVALFAESTPPAGWIPIKNPTVEFDGKVLTITDEVER